MATSAVRVGMLILAEPPFAHALHDDQLTKRCDATLAAADGLLRCSGCKHVWSGAADTCALLGRVQSM